MHILKLPWFGHRTENKQVECYSVTINADGSRLASGGLDGNIKIWDTKSILEFKALSKEQPQASPKKKKSNADKQQPFDRMDLPSLALKRPLCSMSRHNGVVTSVKFSPDGRLLASGSDDKICLIWEKDEGPAQKQLGEAEADLEHWTVRKRLVAHDNDIQDICWSPDGLLLVTVGLDRSIIIWNGVTFERIKRYDIHQSMVKGIVFDPANKYFATASDDRTVRIFRYYKKLNEHSNYEFQMEHIVMEPFKKSPLTSYFRRMSWSPDGQHIAVPNATNGPVSTVVIINRANWGTDVSLIGHEAPCEVCSFSPRLFEIGTEGGKKSKDKNLGFTTVLATAGQDRNLAIWSTANSRPLVVAEDITDNSITDMCWSPDGQTLYLCCLDGSITCVSFEANELGEVVSEDMIDVQLHKYGADRESAIFPESIEQLILEEKSGSQENNFPQHKPTKPASEAEKSPANVPTKSEPMGLPTSLAMPKVNNLTPKQLTKMTQSVTITKNGKKRVAPLLVQASSKRDTSLSVTQISRDSGIKSNQISHKLSQPSYFLPRLGINTSVHGIKHKHADNHTSNETKIMDQDNDNEDMGIDEAANTANTISESGLRRQRTKMKRSIMEVKYPTSFKKISNLPETLFNNQAMLSQEVNQLVNNLSNSSAEFQSDFLNYTFLDVDEELLFSVIIQGIEHEAVSDPLKFQADQTKIITTIEVRNGQGWSIREDELTQNESVDFNDPTRVIVSNNRDGEARKYLLYFPFKIQHTLPIVIDQKLKYFVLVSFKGTIQIIHADSGTYLCPSFEMGENIVFLRHVNGFLVVLTSTGLFYSWKLSDSQTKIESILKGISVASVLNNSDVSSPSDMVCSNSDMKKIPHFILPNLSAIDISPKDGTPFLVIGNSNDIFNYSLDLGAWTKVVDSWYYATLEDDLKTDENTNEALNRLMFKTYNDYKEDVRKSKVNSYTFTNKSQELKEVMVERFGEILQLAT